MAKQSTVKQKLEEQPIFDVAILQHGFTPYMRDYDLLIETNWIDNRAGQYLYRFTHVVETQYETRVRDDVWPLSWDDVLTNYKSWEEAGEPDGFVWGVCWSNAYPGLGYQYESARAKGWSERLGKEMHEIAIETEAFRLGSIFHDVIIRKVNDDTSLIDKVFIPLKD